MESNKKLKTVTIYNLIQQGSKIESRYMKVNIYGHI